MTGAAAPRLAADPRPVVVPGPGGHRLLGGRCRSCGHALTRQLPRCPRCRGGDVGVERFGPGGSVWAVTVLHIGTGDRDVPYTLAYVDLDDGPRLLVHLLGDAAIGARVRLAPPTATGDPAAAVLP